MTDRATTPGPRPDAPRRPDPVGEREEAILETATRLFRTKGYAGTSMQDIADTLGMFKGSLYHYIASKEELLYRIVVRAQRRGIEAMASWQVVDGDPVVRIHAAVTALTLAFIDDWEAVSVFFQDYRYLTPEHRSDIEADRRLYRGFLVDLIRDGQDAGCIDPDRDPVVTSAGVLGMMQSVCSWYRPGRGIVASHVAREFADFVTAGLACRPRSTGHRAATRRFRSNPYSDVVWGIMT